MSKRTVLTTAIALAGSIWTCAALAESTVGKPIDKVDGIGKITEWIGREVKDQQGNEVGKISDFAVNLKEATIPYAVVELDGMFNSKHIAVPLSALSPTSGDDETLSLAASESQWKGAKTFGNADWPATATLQVEQPVVASQKMRPGEMKPEKMMSDQDRNFQKMDQDGDGFLSAAEIKSRKGLSVTRDSDTNRDGRIDRAEFSAFEIAEQARTPVQSNAERRNGDDEGRKNSGNQ